MEEELNKFLEEYLDKIYEKCKKSYSAQSEIDLALGHLILANIKRIIPIFEDEIKCTAEFQKCFRQGDICENGNMDMAIWHLINLSEFFRQELLKFIHHNKV